MVWSVGYRLKYVACLLFIIMIGVLFLIPPFLCACLCHPTLHARQCTHAACDAVCTAVMCNVMDHLKDIIKCLYFDWYVRVTVCFHNFIYM